MYGLLLGRILRIDCGAAAAWAVWSAPESLPCSPPKSCINVAMCLMVGPRWVLPLPLLSAGGSSVLGLFGAGPGAFGPPRRENNDVQLRRLLRVKNALSSSKVRAPAFPTPCGNCGYRNRRALPHLAVRLRRRNHPAAGRRWQTGHHCPGMEFDK